VIETAIDMLDALDAAGDELEDDADLEDADGEAAA
jgi:hypothetical protein